jgi:DDE family transposase
MPSTRALTRNIATGRRKHNEPAPTLKGRRPGGMTLKQEMARKLATKAGAAVYARRKTIAEPPFGQIRAARGFRCFLLRGIDKARGEWSLITMTHNLLKLFRSTLGLALRAKRGGTRGGLIPAAAEQSPPGP